MESKGEKRVRELLEEVSYPFTQEHTFPDCLGYKKTRLRFDFYVKHPILGSVCIEYEGEQHYTYVQHFSKTEAKFRYARHMDILKASYCLTHNIPLFCIPYWDYGTLNHADDLFRAEYRVKNREHTLRLKPPQNK